MYENESSTSIVLPSGFAFTGESLPVGTTPGSYTIKGSYTPSDTTNYVVVTNIDIPVTVLEKYFSVKFYDYYGTQAGSTQSIRYKHAASAPTIASEVTAGGYLFQFTGWNSDAYKNVTGDLDIRAVYKFVSTVKSNVYVLKDGVSRPTTDGGLDSNKYTLATKDAVIKLSDNDAVQLAIQAAITKYNTTGVHQEIIIASEVSKTSISGSYNVESYLSADTIAALKNNSVCNSEGNYYTDWYVLKFRTDDGWHLDGERIYNTYNITWKNYDGTTLSTSKVRKGVVPEYTESTPTKPTSDGKTYIFAGWDVTPVAATEDATYTATFREYTAPTFTLSLSGNKLTIIASTKIDSIKYRNYIYYYYDLSYTEKDNIYTATVDKSKLKSIRITSDGITIEYTYSSGTFTKN